MMPPRWIILCAGFALALLWTCGVAGCANRNPWAWNTPPTRVEPSPATRTDRKTIVVVGDFTDPTGAPPYARGVGRYMSEAFSRALLNDGNYDVWINPALSREAEQIAFAGGPRPAPGLQAQGSEAAGQRSEACPRPAGPGVGGQRSEPVRRPPTSDL